MIEEIGNESLHKNLGQKLRSFLTISEPEAPRFRVQ